MTTEIRDIQGTMIVNPHYEYDGPTKAKTVVGITLTHGMHDMTLSVNDAAFFATGILGALPPEKVAEVITEFVKRSRT